MQPSIRVQKGMLTHLRLPDFVVAKIPGLSIHESDLTHKTILLNELWIDDHGLWKRLQKEDGHPEWLKHKIRIIVIEKEDHPSFPYEACGFVSQDMHRLNAYFHIFQETWSGHHSENPLHDEICQCLRLT